jgi:hypothetical protein
MRRRPAAIRGEEDEDGAVEHFLYFGVGHLIARLNPGT